MTKHTCDCRSCGGSIKGELYHLGFSDMEAVYCDSCPNVLLLKDREYLARNGVQFPYLQAGDKGWEYYNRHLLPYYEMAEKYFPNCACGGRFRYMSAPRCPSCGDYIMGKGFEEPVDRNLIYVFISRDSIEL